MKKKIQKAEVTGSALVQKINDFLRYEATPDDIPQLNDQVLLDVPKSLRDCLRQRMRKYRTDGTTILFVRSVFSAFPWPAPESIV